MPRETLDTVAQCDVEPVLYDTFDDITYKLAGRDVVGKIHGFLFKPRRPLPSDQQLAVIYSFYGGGNSYDMLSHVLCQAGIYVFSPAPRGDDVIPLRRHHPSEGVRPTVTGVKCKGLVDRGNRLVCPAGLFEELSKVAQVACPRPIRQRLRSEEHTSELQSH